MGPKAPDIAAAGMTPELQPAMPGAPRQELANLAREQVKQKNYREANKIVRGALPEQQKSDQKAEQMGVSRDKDGKKTRAAGSPEKTRFDKIRTADARARAFLNKGYGVLPTADKIIIRDAVLNAARKSPLVAAELSKITGAGAQAKLNAFAERIIKEDPKFAAEAARNFDEWIESPELADIVTPLDIKVTELTYQWELKQYDSESVKARLTDVDAKLADYDRQPSGIKGAKAQELDNLKQELPTLTETAAGWRGNVQDIEKRLDLLRRGTATTTTVSSGLPGGGGGARSINVVDVDAVKTAEDELKDARNELAKIDAKTNRIKELEQEETTLKQNKRELEREDIEKEMETLKAQMELTKASGELADAKALRESQETDVVKGIEDVFLRAAEGTFDNQTDAFLEAADEQVAAFAEQAKEANQKAVDKILQERYWTTVKRRKWPFGPLEDKSVIKRAEVNEDYATLMKQGPEATMRKILEKSKNPTTGEDYTTTEVDELLQDKEYVESVQPVMMTYLLAQRMVTSGVTQEDARIITMSSWGQDIITNALDVNKKVTSDVERLIEAKYLDRHGFMERLKSEMSKNPALWLLILLGGIAAVPVGIIGGSGVLAGLTGGGLLGGVGAVGKYGMQAHEIAPEDESARAA